jgi:hypothetical protein
LRLVRLAYYARLAVPDASPQISAELEALAANLASYFGATVQRLHVLASGWETTLYEFELRGNSALLPGVETGVPLVLRFYPSIEAADKGALEYRTITYLAGAGYPVPRPYLFEPGGAAIGAPFMVMERLGGGPLFAIRAFLLDGLFGIRPRPNPAASHRVNTVRARGAGNSCLHRPTQTREGARS